MAVVVDRGRYKANIHYVEPQSNGHPKPSRAAKRAGERQPEAKRRGEAKPRSSLGRSRA